MHKTCRFRNFGKMCPGTCTTTSGADDSFSHRHSPGINSSKSLQSSLAMTGKLSFKMDFTTLKSFHFFEPATILFWVIPTIYKSQINPVTYKHLIQQEIITEFVTQRVRPCCGGRRSKRLGSWSLGKPSEEAKFGWREVMLFFLSKAGSSEPTSQLQE